MNSRGACALFLGTAFLVLFVVLVSPAPALPAAEPISPAVGVALWQDRAYEALLQGMIILAGVLSILLLLGRNPSGRMPP